MIIGLIVATYIIVLMDPFMGGIRRKLEEREKRREFEYAERNSI